MTEVSEVTVCGFAWNAGFRGFGNLTEVTCLAMVTSHGDPEAPNGLWGLGGGGDGNSQAITAFETWKRDGDWRSFPNNSNLSRHFYRPLAASAATFVMAREGVEGNVIQPAGDAVVATGEVVADTAHLIGAVLNPRTWVRTAKVALGGLLIVAAGVMLARGKASGTVAAITKPLKGK